MKFIKPSSLPDLFDRLQNYEGRKFFLAGGSDINIQIKNRMIRDEPIFYINHLDELRGIQVVDDTVIIGALTSYADIISSPILKEKLPFFRNSLKLFASPLLQSVATIGGNIANSSPTADILPLLLVLDAEVRLLTRSKLRFIPINEFYTGYKEYVMKTNEIIGSVHINIDAEKNWLAYYRKVGSRQSLTIAKLALAGIMKLKENSITAIKIAAGALNEYPRRLTTTENYLKSKRKEDIADKELKEVLTEDITPITDLRSDKNYRFDVCLNLIKEFINSY